MNLYCESKKKKRSDNKFRSLEKDQVSFYKCSRRIRMDLCINFINTLYEIKWKYQFKRNGETKKKKKKQIINRIKYRISRNELN